MNFSLEKMREIKTGEIPEMLSIINSSGGRTRPLHKPGESFTDKINIISELKHSSPSAGKLSGLQSDDDIIMSYISGGASAISVLTEKKYFGGSYIHLQNVSSMCQKPVLCKDFIFYGEQIEAAYVSGADMVLLISKILEKDQMKYLYEKVISYGMTPLVEIHEKSEIDVVMSLGPEFVLVNMRNLETLEIDYNTGIETLKNLPEDITAISASGINSKSDIMKIMNQTGANSFLIGSSLMKSGDPEGMLREFKNVH